MNGPGSNKSRLGVKNINELLREAPRDLSDQTMPKTFEASLNELERIVKQLEDGDMPLEDSLKLFSRTASACHANAANG